MKDTPKVKGLLKGLRKISQVFEEDKPQEIQIGAPTDVKHVSHIGSDAPQAQESPSWMKGGGPSSEAHKDGPGCVSEDSGQKTPRREHEDRIKTRHRRHRSAEMAPDPVSEAKPRQPRRHHTRGHEGRHSRSDSLPDVPKRTHKKKPKDDVSSQNDVSSQKETEEK